MSDLKRTADRAAGDDPIDLTRTIKKLSMPVQPVDDDFDAAEFSALLFCQDAAAKKWAPRWLNQAGIQANVPPDPENAVHIARSQRPHVILVEARLLGQDRKPVYQALLDAADLDVPVIVLCSGGKEALAAVEAGAFDVTRKPFEWQLISRRTRHAAHLGHARMQLKDRTKSLSTALELADAARQQLRSRESFEPVTGLPNKTKFIDLLRRGMSAVDRDQNNLAVFVVGFNRFQLVIEAMGQERADLIHSEIGIILAECLHDADISGSISSGLKTAAAASLDHFRFALMMTYSGDLEQLSELRQSLLEKLSRPVQVDGQTVYLSACLGVTLYPQDANDVDSLLQRADNAMRDAQSRGGGFRYYCRETDAAAARKLKIEHMLHEALTCKDLSLAYQPINDTQHGSMVAAEALLRWRQSDGSLISPKEFVPIAEESDLMIRIGEFVLNEACRQHTAWRNAGIRLPRMCVNVSKVQFMAGGLVPALTRILKLHNVDPTFLELEISERGVLAGEFDVLSQLHELKNLGIRLSIDDFGTGDSAIAYLKEMPIDVLKIDRSYICDIVANRKDEAITSAIVALAQRLNMTVVAEGVETQEQLKILQRLGCDEFQGFLVSKPVAPRAFVSLLESRK